MNKQPDKKELDKKAGNEPDVKEWEEIPAAIGGGEWTAEYDLPEAAVPVRSSTPGRIPEAGNPKPVFDMLSGRKGPDGVRAARARGMEKNQNMTDFINLLGWLSKGDPRKPLPVPVRRSLPPAFGHLSGESDELPEFKGVSTGLKPSAGGETPASARLRGQQAEKEPLRSGSAGQRPGEGRKKDEPEPDGRPLPGGVGLDELYMKHYQQDFESLVRALDTPVKRQGFYNALVKGGRDVGSYADFEAGVSKDLEKVLGEKEVRSHRDEQVRALYAMTGGRLQEFQAFRERMDDPANWDSFYREATARGLDLGGYDDFVANLSGSNKKQAKPKEPEGFWDSYGGDLLERAGAATLDLNGTIYSAGDLVDRIAIRPFLDLIDPTIRRPFREWADNEYAKADELRRRSNRYGGKTLIEQWKKGDYLDLLGNLGLGLGESLPEAATAVATKGATLVVQGITHALKKYDDLNRMPETRDMPELQKAINAVTTGAMEALTDKLGGKAMGKEFRNVYKNMEKSVMKRDVSKQVSNWVRDMYRKLGILPESVGEGVEEMANQIGENIADYTTGATDEWAPMKGVPEGLANGIAEGIAFKRLPGMPGQGMDYRNRKRADGNAKPDGYRTETAR